MSHQSTSDIGKSAQQSIHNITGGQVRLPTARLDTTCPRLPVSDLPLQELTSESDYAKGEASSNSAGKHVLQESSILGHLRRVGASSDTRSGVECDGDDARHSTNSGFFYFGRGRVKLGRFGSKRPFEVYWP